MKSAFALVAFVAAVLFVTAAVALPTPTTTTTNAAASSGAVGAQVTATSAGPSASDFEITEWHVDSPNASGSYYVRGEVRNRGSVAGGVELQYTVRDASRRVIDSGTFWPNSTRNIAPGAAVPIGYPVTQNTTAATFSLDVASAQVWR